MISLNTSVVKDKRIIAKIINKLSNTMYLVEDSKERTFSVESNGTYREGSTVIVKNNVIIASTRSRKSIKQFTV